MSQIINSELPVALASAHNSGIWIYPVGADVVIRREIDNMSINDAEMMYWDGGDFIYYTKLEKELIKYSISLGKAVIRKPLKLNGYEIVFIARGDNVMNISLKPEIDFSLIAEKYMEKRNNYSNIYNLEISLDDLSLIRDYHSDSVIIDIKGESYLHFRQDKNNKDHYTLFLNQSPVSEDSTMDPRYLWKEAKLISPTSGIHVDNHFLTLFILEPNGRVRKFRKPSDSVLPTILIRDNFAYVVVWNPGRETTTVYIVNSSKHTMTKKVIKFESNAQSILNDKYLVLINSKRGENDIGEMKLIDLETFESVPTSTLIKELQKQIISHANQYFPKELSQLLSAYIYPDRVTPPKKLTYIPMGKFRFNLFNDSSDDNFDEQFKAVMNFIRS